LWQAAGSWLQQAKDRPNVSVSFGPNQWIDMHGGGTCIYPHCRPQGLYNPDNKTWNVRLFWKPDKTKKPELLLDSFNPNHADSAESTVKKVYSALKKELQRVK